MPWTIDKPPSCAENWTEPEKRRCVEAANARLAEGGEDAEEQAIYACIHAAGKSDEQAGGKAMSEHEIKTVPFEVTALDAPGRTVEGYAAVFNNVDAGGDIIHPGAFRKTLSERGHLLKFLWQHDTKEPLGKIVEAREDQRGLFIKAVVSDTARGRDALALLRDNAIEGLSIGYDPVKGGTDYATVTGGTVRNLRELKLYECSLVTFQMNPEAAVTALKTETAVPEPEPEEQKAGRTISAATHGKLKAAMSQMQAAMQTVTDLLSAAGISDEAATEDEPKTAPEPQAAETKGEAGPVEPPTSEDETLLQLIDIELRQLESLEV